MDYKTQYQSLIESRKLLNRTKKAGDGLERHHIIPACLGGDNGSDNLVCLTPREHFIAHWMLYKIHNGKDKAKMAYAFFSMCSNNPNQQRTITARQYETAKNSMIASCTGENHPGFGKNPFSEEQLTRLSEIKKGEKNPMFGKTPWNKGITLRPKTEDEKKNLSEKNKGQTRSIETKKKMSLSAKGKLKSEEHKLSISNATKGKPRPVGAGKKTGDALRGRTQAKITCPHCGKIGGTAMKRWHFERCKVND
jgi:hypothetical protein